MGESGLDGLPFWSHGFQQRLLAAVQQFSEPEWSEISNCEPCFPCPYFETEESD